MEVLFLNGPVQNGAFDFQDKPGKAVGIRIAAALNSILDVGPAPHLWNTVTLEGDLRHRRSTVSPQVSRREFETDLISSKYPPESRSATAVATDTDAEVQQLALEMIERRLRAGLLRISAEAVPTCRDCGHMTGHGASQCKACGGLRIRLLTSRHLVAENPEGALALGRADIHASQRRQPLHLQSTSSFRASCSTLALASMSPYSLWPDAQKHGKQSC
jgi:hypothetical protein